LLSTIFLRATDCYTALWNWQKNFWKCSFSVFFCSVCFSEEKSVNLYIFSNNWKIMTIKFAQKIWRKLQHWLKYLMSWFHTQNVFLLHILYVVEKR
jgi:hypothetical protein